MNAQIETYTIQGALPGPTVAIIGGVHGNEPVGVMAISRLSSCLTVERGMVILVIANPPAIKAQRRFIDVNLNRALVRPVDQNTIEGRLANQLMDVLDGCDALLDLHSGIGNEPPFVICEKDALEVASYFPVDIVSTGWTTAEPGSTDAYLFNRGKPAICLECEDVSVAVEAVEIYLSYLGLVSAPLPETRIQQIIQIKEVVMKRKADFRFSRDFTSFEQLKPGELIATEYGQSHYAPQERCCIIFPWPEAPISAEAYLIGVY